MAVRRVVAAASTVAGAVALLTACGNNVSSEPPGSTTSSPSTHVSGPVASPPHTIVGSPVSPASGSTGPGGTSDDPVAVTPTTDLLGWRPVSGPTSDVVTVGGDWTLTVDRSGRTARLVGPHPRTFRPGSGARISDALLDGTHALVVSEDKLAQTPDVATLVDLGSGRTRRLDRTSSPPTSVGGTWALGPSTLAHATAGPHRSYCVTWLRLDTLRPDAATCVPPRNGLSRASITADGSTLMRFDAHHPSCRTLLVRSGSSTATLPGVAPCKGWDSAAMPDGAIWSVIPKERRIEAAHFYAHSAVGWYDLGPGASGSLVACAGAAYFARDPATNHDPATLLRWDPRASTLSVVFASKGLGQAFLSSPRCGGDHLTVTAFSSAGDQQVTAVVGAP